MHARSLGKPSSHHITPKASSTTQKTKHILTRLSSPCKVGKKRRSPLSPLPQAHPVRCQAQAQPRLLGGGGGGAAHSSTSYTVQLDTAGVQPPLLHPTSSFAAAPHSKLPRAHMAHCSTHPTPPHCISLKPAQRSQMAKVGRASITWAAFSAVLLACC